MDGLSPSDLTDDALTDRIRVLQRRGGHRYSFDDVVTAWVAVRTGGHARTYLDLGCGLGSVLLMVADRLPGVRALGIEAQAESFALARENVARSWLADRVIVRRGDLRDSELCEHARDEFVSRRSSAFAADGSPLDSWRGFDLITATPPYKKPGTATPSPDPQRAHARIELRGGVEEYLATASRMLAPAGTVIICMETGAITRVEAAARAARLALMERVDVVPIAIGKGRLFSVFTLQHARAGRLAAAEASPMSPNIAPHPCGPHREWRVGPAQLAAAEASPRLEGGASPNTAPNTGAAPHSRECAALLQPSAAEPAALPLATPSAGAPNARGCSSDMQIGDSVAPRSAEQLRAISDPVALLPTDGRSAASHGGSAGMPSAAVSTLLLRDASGARTPAALELRRFFGLGDPVDEQPSPPRMSLDRRSMA